MRLEFTVDGKIPALSGGTSRSRFTPREVTAYRALVQFSARKAAGFSLEPYGGLVAVSIEAHGYSGDADNAAKCVLDAINKHVIADDSQVAHLTVSFPGRQLAAGGRPRRPKDAYQGVRVVVESL